MLTRALLVLIAVAVAGSVWLASASSVPIAVARFREVEQSHTSLGSFGAATETWRTAVLLQRSNKRVGTAWVACIRVARSSAARKCSGTYQLPEGSIELAGVVSSRSRFTLLIVGTSGVYEGQSGSAQFSQVGSSPRSSLVTFYLQ
jgi:hypothetical protein